jgi:hypothetical protein
MAHKVGQKGIKIQRKLIREEGEKHRGLTRRTSVWSGKPEEDLTDRISPENVGDFEDEFFASVASRLDSLNGEDADDVAKLQDAPAWGRVHCNGGATARSGRWFSVVRKQRGRTRERWRGWRREDGRRGARVCWDVDLLLLGIKREEGKVVVGVLADVCREGFMLAACSYEEDDIKGNLSPRSGKVASGWALVRKKKGQEEELDLSPKIQNLKGTKR